MLRGGVRYPDAVLAARTKRDEQHVILDIEQLGQLRAQAFHFSRRHPAAKNRIFHRGAVALHVLGAAPQPFRLAYVIGHEPPSCPLHLWTPAVNATASGRKGPALPSIPSPASGPPARWCGHRRASI